MPDFVTTTKTQGQLYKYLLFSEDSVRERIPILEKMLEVFPQDKAFLQPILDSARKTEKILSYAFLVKHLDFPHQVEVDEGEVLPSTPEAHLLLVSEEEKKAKSRNVEELEAVSSHLRECEDPEECAKGNCPFLKGKDPAMVLDKVQVRLSGPTQERRELCFSEIYSQRKNRSLGALTFIKPFDVETQGLEPGTLTVVAGWTGSFKTTFGLNMAHQNAVRNGYNTVFITSEIPKKLLYLWLLCRHSYEEKFSDHGPVPRLDTQKATLSDEDEAFIRDVVEPDLKNNPEYGKILILDELDFRSFSKAGIKSKLLSLEWEVDILLYDYIQLTKFLEEAQAISRTSRVDPVNVYVRIFTDLAMHLYGGSREVISVLLSQINREGWKEACDNDGEYRLTALAEANELEKSASYVITLFSDQNLKESGEVKAQLLKHRGGLTVETAVLVPMDPRYLAMGHGIEGFGETESSDMSGLLMSGSGGLFGGL